MTPADHDALREGLAQFLFQQSEYPILSRRTWKEAVETASVDPRNRAADTIRHFRSRANGLLAGPLAHLLVKAESAERVAADYERGLKHRNDLMDRVVMLKTEAAAATARADRLAAENAALRAALGQIAAMTEMGLVASGRPDGTATYEWSQKPSAPAEIARAALRTDPPPPAGTDAPVQEGTDA